MIKHFYGPKKRRKFDIDAEWLPQKNRQFALKGSVDPPQEPAQPQVPPQPETPTPTTENKTTDDQGLKTAYKAESGFYRDADRALHMAGTRGSVIGEDWMDNCKACGPNLFNTMNDYYGLLNSGKFGFKDWFAPESQPNNIEDAKMYKALDQYTQNNTG